MATADLADVLITGKGKSPLRVEAMRPRPQFIDYGGKPSLDGVVSTIKSSVASSAVIALLRQRLSEPGAGRVLVVDVAGSEEGAVLGDRLVGLAIRNNWEGLVVHGYLRDVKELKDMPICIKALGVDPVRGVDQGVEAESDVPVTFSGVTFAPGNHIVGDEDGVLVGDTVSLYELARKLSSE
mmetsp:Transcript_1508/g.3180  ORF Transcript_1508/g.3180 Transcript_1508/m.3180 type:complete len:182 (+) Transcript_1508:60-605(+)